MDTEADRIRARVPHLVAGPGGAWICGVAVLPGCTAGAPTADDLDAVLRLSVADGFFPAGRAAYVALPVTEHEVSDDAAVYLAHTPGGDSALLVALLPAGAVVVAQSFTVDTADGAVQGFLLADVEALVADLFVVAHQRADLVAHTGDVETSVTLHDCTPGHDAGLWMLDEATGAAVPATLGRPDDFRIEARSRVGGGIDELFAQVHAAATTAAHRFGALAPQWLAAPGTEDLRQELDARAPIDDRRRAQREGPAEAV